MIGASLLSVIFLVLFIGLIIALALLRTRWPVSFRTLKGYQALAEAIEQSVESGERVHVSLGTGTLLEQDSAPALAGLAILHKIARSTAMSDKPVVVTAGNGAMMVLAQDTLRTAYRKAGAAPRFQLVSGRFLGPTPFAYAAGLPETLRAEDVSVNVLSGSFGLEGGLAATFGKKHQDAFVLAGTDDVQTQALLYATADYPLIGEEVFASGAYLERGPLHRSSLRAQDMIRLGMIGLILLGTLLATLGVIR
jgi:hypothetical protein